MKYHQRPGFSHRLHDLRRGRHQALFQDRPGQREGARASVGVEELKGGREQIVITEIPYNVNRAAARVSASPSW